MCWESIQKMFQYICSLVIVDIRYIYLFVIICICFLVLTYSSFICYLEMLPLFSNQVDISKAFVHCSATPKLAKLSGCS